MIVSSCLSVAWCSCGLGLLETMCSGVYLTCHAKNCIQEVTSGMRKQVLPSILFQLATEIRNHIGCYFILDREDRLKWLCFDSDLNDCRTRGTFCFLCSTASTQFINTLSTIFLNDSWPYCAVTTASKHIIHTAVIEAQDYLIFSEIICLLFISRQHCY